MAAIIDYRGKTPRKTAAGIPLITAKIVKGGRIERPEEFIDPSDYEDWMRRGLPDVGDVVITTEAPLGEVAQLADSRVALAQRLILLRGKQGLLDNRYLKYLLMSDAMQRQLVSRASGTTVVGIKQSELRKIKLPLPPIVAQEAIAAVLGALDDKIEQNRRTGRALEALARATFKAWFVDFDPVKAKAAGATSFPGMPPAAFAGLPDRLTDCALGPVPEGWPIGTLGDLVRERGERITPGEETRRLPYVPIDSITSKRITLETFKSGEEAQSSLIRFQFGDVLFGAMRPYFHKVCLAPFEGSTRTTCFVLTPHLKSDTAFSLMLMSEDATVEFATTHSVGSTIPYAKWDGSLREMPCILPPESLRGALFQAVADPMLRLSNHGTVESLKLAALRDYLLPRLLDGKVRVSHVDAPTGEAP